MANEFEMVERYLKARMATMHPTPSSTDTPADRARPFITISRQAGAGGHALATAIIENFATHDDSEIFGGWRIFDQELCQIVASDPRFADHLGPLLDEEYRSATSEMIRQLLRPSVDQDAVMNRVFQVVGAVAVIGRTIIVGRAGSEVTRDLESGISVRLIAPIESRLERLQNNFGIPRSEASTLARKLDSQRSRLLRAHFGTNIDDPLRYDATFNTARLGFEEIAEAIAGTVSQRAMKLLELPEQV